VSDAELELYRRRNIAAWFDGADPFERLPGHQHLHTIRKRDDGACVFLNADNKCRIHVELGAARKPLTCRLFPYSFHPAPDATVVTASFACPTIVANQGTPIASGAALEAIESLRKEWGAAAQPRGALELIAGRSIEPRQAKLLRDNLLVMLKRDSGDIRVNIRRMAATLDDLTRGRVLALADAEFSEYVSLTVPHAATTADVPPPRQAGWIAALLQYGFLYTVLAVRAGLEYPQPSRAQLRLRRLRLLAHFHGLAPGDTHINVKALARRRVDINHHEIRPIVFHYLGSTIETLGARGMPIVNELAVQVSYLNAARALAAMKADAAGRDADRAMFSEALMEAADVSHATSGVLERILNRFAAGTEALWKLAS
jgi:Fe-S-cluster containining protein